MENNTTTALEKTSPIKQRSLYGKTHAFRGHEDNILCKVDKYIIVSGKIFVNWEYSMGLLTGWGFLRRQLTHAASNRCSDEW